MKMKSEKKAYNELLKYSNFESEERRADGHWEREWVDAKATMSAKHARFLWRYATGKLGLLPAFCGKPKFVEGRRYQFIWEIPRAGVPTIFVCRVYPARLPSEAGPGYQRPAGV